MNRIFNCDLLVERISEFEAFRREVFKNDRGRKERRLNFGDNQQYLQNDIDLELKKLL